MTGKPAPELDELDLVVRARAGALSARERDAFAQALATSATVRTAYEVGSALDAASRVRTGDETLVERALEGTLASERPNRRPRKPRLAAALAATLALASAAAATRQVLVWRAEGRPAQRVHGAVPQPEPNPASRQAERSPPALATTIAEQPTTTPAPPTAHTQRDAPVPQLTRAPSAGSPAPPPATAASLFREAGAARRNGDLARARALYVELEQRFSGSNEARVSRVSLGKLCLSAGNPRDAEAAFAQYLRSGAADLREEALVGRADALLALGRSAEERAVRQELVRRYPASVYANRARERIAEIDGADGTRSP